MLAPQEVDALLRGRRPRCAPRASSIVIITHKLREARAIADRADRAARRPGGARRRRPRRPRPTPSWSRRWSAAVPPPLPAERAAVPRRRRRRRCVVDGVSVRGTDGRDRAARTSTSTSGPASSSASPACPATASASCSRSSSALRPLAGGHGPHRPAAERRRADPRGRCAPAPSACPRTRSPTPSCPASTCSSTSCSTAEPLPGRGLGVDWRGRPQRELDGQDAARRLNVAAPRPAGGRRCRAATSSGSMLTRAFLAGRRRRSVVGRLPEPGPRHRHVRGAPRSCCSSGGPRAPGC